jgi:hypothetical protein
MQQALKPASGAARAEIVAVELFFELDIAMDETPATPDLGFRREGLPPLTRDAESWGGFRDRDACAWHPPSAGNTADCRGASLARARRSGSHTARFVDLATRKVGTQSTLSRHSVGTTKSRTRNDEGYFGERRSGSPKTRRLFCPTSQVRHAKILFFLKGVNYDLTKPARLDTEGRMAIRHQT